jgi:Flp pilus assembly protein TadG
VIPQKTFRKAVQKPIRRLRKRRGATMVEFAIVAPVVILFVFAAIEFTRVISIRHSVDNAVYESARLAMVPGGTATDAQNESRRLLAAMGIKDYLVDVTPAVLTSDSPTVTVRISVPLDANSYLPQKFFAGRTLRRELTLRREGR